MSVVDLLFIGGSVRPGSVSTQVLRACVEPAERHGARVRLLTGPQLVLPLYTPGPLERPPAVLRLVEALRRADGVVIATPTYHGGMSGMLKNALDYAEDLATGVPAYLEGRVVGTVAVGWSEHGAATAVADLRGTAMSLRAWVTPMAVTVNSNALPPGGPGADPRTARRLEILVDQVTDFARRSTSAGWPAGVEV